MSYNRRSYSPTSSHGSVTASLEDFEHDGTDFEGSIGDELDNSLPLLQQLDQPDSHSSLSSDGAAAGAAASAVSTSVGQQHATAFRLRHAHRPPTNGSQHSIPHAGTDDQDGNATQNQNPVRWLPPHVFPETYWQTMVEGPGSASVTGSISGAGTGSASGHSRSRDGSPEYQTATEMEGLYYDDPDLTIPAKIPLPPSPTKGRSRTTSPIKREESLRRAITSMRLKREGTGDIEENEVFVDPERREEGDMNEKDDNTYFRITMRAEIQHRVEPIAAFFTWCRAQYQSAFKTPTSALLSTLSLSLFVSLIALFFSSPDPGPMPDLIKLSGLAGQFEPLIQQSENSLSQSQGLLQTSMAVWDLGESVRSARWSAGNALADELEQLSKKLDTLGMALTTFFAHVDGDTAGILMIMDWCKLNLAELQSRRSFSPLSTLYDNAHLHLSRLGLLEDEDGGVTTTTWSVLDSIFGQPRTQRTRGTLQHLFNDFVEVLEESIHDELTHSVSLLAIFEDIDRHFLNLRSSVIVHADAQDRAEDELLSSLWVRVIGARAPTLRKFEKNRRLLAHVQQLAVHNKFVLSGHHKKLLQLKGNLDILRQRLASDIIRANESIPLSIEQQIRGLEGAIKPLKEASERRKARFRDDFERSEMTMTKGYGAASLGLDGKVLGIQSA